MVKNGFKFKAVLGAMIIFWILPLLAEADSINARNSFFIDPFYDALNRDRISAILIEENNRLYFYIEEGWWQKLDAAGQDWVRSSLVSLGRAFEEEIYPRLTGAFGFERKPGIDNDEKITVLLHQMKNETRGYFRTNDAYYNFQVTDSNEREMVYLNVNGLNESLAPSYLAHEFMHLISGNQKERRFGVDEEIWVLEMFSEIAATVVGYDENYAGSNLAQRVGVFLKRPTDSLTEWRGAVDDYGVANVFGQYLAGQYGLGVFQRVLNTSQTGVAGFNQALAGKTNEDLRTVFHRWLVAVSVNDCSLGKEYCYQNESLARVKVSPSLYFLPSSGNAAMKIENSIKDWSGRWYKLVGGQDSLKLNFDGLNEIDFKISYFVCKKTGECFLEDFILDSRQDGELIVSDFGNDYSFLTLILSVGEKVRGFGNLEAAYPFSLEIANLSEEEETIASLKKQIAFLRTEIARVQTRIDEILGINQVGCEILTGDLFFGQASNEVRCLQEFLKNQEPEIYPQGIISGYFGALTRAAVIRFQEKYALEILDPLDLEKGTGFVGYLTRAKINEFKSAF